MEPQYWRHSITLDGNLEWAIKRLRGDIDYLQTKLKNMQVARLDGVTTVEEYKEWFKSRSDTRSFHVLDQLRCVKMYDDHYIADCISFLQDIGETVKQQPPMPSEEDLELIETANDKGERPPIKPWMRLKERVAWLIDTVGRAHMISNGETNRSSLSMDSYLHSVYVELILNTHRGGKVTF